jgi:Raf kinase inhibitor-like YbhB/YbcL family protein
MKRKTCALFVWLVLFALVLSQGQVKAETEGVMTVTSTAFEEGGMIPQRYTCDGEDVSPPLKWSGTPEGTKTFALICDDPDAPGETWVHWVLYNIPAHMMGLQEKVSLQPSLESGAEQGTNDFGNFGYGGPCPPGGTHRYFFKLYALDKEIDSGPGLTKGDVVKRMEGHILGEGSLMGKYRR